MVIYLLKRFVSGLIVLFIFLTIMYFAVQLILPGDFASHFSLSLSEKESREFRTQLGLDLPIMQRYLNWLHSLFKGDLGYSFTPYEKGLPVVQVITSTVPATLLVFGIGTILAFLIGSWLGKVAAWQGPGLVSGGITFISISLYTSFPPWLAFLAVYFLSVRLGVGISLGASGRMAALQLSQADLIWVMLVTLFFMILFVWLLALLIKMNFRRTLPIFLYVGMVLVGWVGSWILLDIAPDAQETMRRAALPILLYTLLSFGEIMLIMRTSMIDTLYEDYIKTALAKGLPAPQVRDRHAARNAQLPVITKLVISIPFLFSGLVMIEKVLNWPGIGTALFNAVGMQNIPLMMGMLIFIGIFMLISRLTLEVLYAALDPRLRLGR